MLHLTPHELLTTTRAVRKRLDLSRPVEPEVIHDCIEIATQAPSSGNTQSWHFVLVTDGQKRKALADLYRQAFTLAYGSPEEKERLLAQIPDAEAEQIRASLSFLNRRRPKERSSEFSRILSSATFLAEHMHEVPLLVLPCMQGRFETLPAMIHSSMYGSIYPAIWSFMLAARARGLGTSLTTIHLFYEKQTAELLNIPYEQVTQMALIPVAYTLGTDFRPSSRKPLDTIVHQNEW